MEKLEVEIKKKIMEYVYIFIFLIVAEIFSLILYITAHLLQTLYYESSVYFSELHGLINGCLFNAIILQIVVIIGFILFLAHFILNLTGDKNGKLSIL